MKSSASVVAGADALLAGLTVPADAGVITTMGYTGSISHANGTGTATTKNFSGSTGVVNEHSSASVGANGRSSGGIDSDVTVDDRGFITFNNAIAAAGGNSRVQSTTLIHQRVRNDTGVAKLVQYDSMIFAGYSGIFLPDYSNPACSDNVLQCSQNPGGDAFGHYYDTNGSAGIDFDFKITAVVNKTMFDPLAAYDDARSIYTLDMGMHLTVENGAFQGFSWSPSAPLNNFRQVASGAEQSAVISAWDETRIESNVVVLQPGEWVDIVISNDVSGYSDGLCYTDQERSCAGIFGLLGDPIMSGVDRGGGSRSLASALRSLSIGPMAAGDDDLFFFQGVEPKPEVTYQPLVYFADPNNPLDRYLVNPIPLAAVPAPAAAGLFGLGLAGVGLRRRRRG